MKKYDVTITEIQSLKVSVEANSQAEAEELVEGQWNRSEHILDAEAFDHAEFDAVEAKQERT